MRGGEGDKGGRGRRERERKEGGRGGRERKEGESHILLSLLADFFDPFVPPSSAGRGKPSGSGPAPSEEDVSMLLAMGFSRDQALKGLQQTVGVGQCLR